MCPVKEVHSAHDGAEKRRRAYNTSRSSALTKSCSDAATQCSNNIARASAVFYFASPSAFREMDELSDIASIIAVLQLTGEVIKYLKDITDAPK